MARKGKKTRKYLGTRSHGAGNTKNRRGSGCRGGTGKAGIDKHKWSWAMNVDKNYYSKHGFSRPNKTRVNAINLFEINQRAITHELKKKDDKYLFEFDGKVLATGSVSVPLSIKAVSWSKNVEKKLKEVGGEISKLKS
ncbi:50S ribosomal protein L15 [Candidatus Micrarchaeota archaeon]|nr:50S ribosomal protein L15 [Candidatus Micrarchaeota archaeon]